jgi:hypothetical protein
MKMINLPHGLPSSKFRLENILNSNKKVETKWVPFFKVQLPDFEEFLFFYDIAGGTEWVLKPEILEWCKENIRGLMTHPKIDYTSMINEEPILVYVIQFEEEHDAILFKLRWVG